MNINKVQCLKQKHVIFVQKHTLMDYLLCIYQP